MKKRYILILVAALFGLFAAFPFLSLKGGEKLRDYIFREITYRIISDKLIAENDSISANRIYLYVRKHLKTPDAGQLVKDQNVLEILKTGIASCDQQVDVMITLAAVCGIKGRMVFLYGSDSISHHTTGELKIKEKWCMYDPFYANIFVNNVGEIASADDIVKNRAELIDTLYFDQDYYNLFAPKYNYRIFMDNQPGLMRIASRTLVKIWCRVLNRLLLDSYIEAYFKAARYDSATISKLRELLYEKVDFYDFEI